MSEIKELLEEIREEVRKLKETQEERLVFVSFRCRTTWREKIGSQIFLIRGKVTLEELLEEMASNLGCSTDDLLILGISDVTSILKFEEVESCG